MTEPPPSWVRRTLIRPAICDNCNEQAWIDEEVYIMIGSGELYCLECPPDDVEDDGSIAAWVR